MVRIQFDEDKCIGCNLCAELCPKEVLAPATWARDDVPQVISAADCCACMTCAGKCPQGAIRIMQNELENWYAHPGEKPFESLDTQEVAKYANYAAVLEDVLKLRSKPVSISLVPKGEPLPPVPLPSVRLRYCQALLMARRGSSILMPPSTHSCPDGASILGMGKVPRKLATGDIYVRLGKLATPEAAAKMVRERPALPEESISAAVLTPLEKVVTRPDVIAVIAPPETMMWLCMASTYYSGGRSTFQMSSYNAQCVETTLYPYTRREMNMSLGCYGCRAISDVGEEMMFAGIPEDKISSLIDGIEHLGKKAIKDSRAKIYLPPVL